jgi:hypothetical protein
MTVRKKVTSLNKRLETLMFPGDKSFCPSNHHPNYDKIGIKTHLPLD